MSTYDKASGKAAIAEDQIVTASLDVLPYPAILATLQTREILTRLRCCPRRATMVVQGLFVLHHVEANR